MKFKSPVLVIGDVMLDHYQYGSVNRISPEAPVPVLKFEREEFFLGGSANVANNLANLNVKCSLFGLIGEPINERRIFNQLMKKVHIKNYLISYKDITTIVKTRVVANNQQIVRIDKENIKTNNDITLPKIKKVLELFKGDIIIISDYGKGLCSQEFMEYVINFSKKNNKIVLVDPKGKDWVKYYGANLVKPNLKELIDIIGHDIKNKDDEIVDNGYKIIKKYNLENLLVTRAEKGMTLITEKQDVYHFKSNTKKVFDVSGAGDTVIATLAFGLLNNYSLQESSEIANNAAGIVVTKFGTTPINIKDIKNL